MPISHVPLLFSTCCSPAVLYGRKQQQCQHTLSNSSSSMPVKSSSPLLPSPAATQRRHSTTSCIVSSLLRRLHNLMCHPIINDLNQYLFAKLTFEKNWKFDDSKCNGGLSNAKSNSSLSFLSAGTWHQLPITVIHVGCTTDQNSRSFVLASHWVWNMLCCI